MERQPPRRTGSFPNRHAFDSPTPAAPNATPPTSSSRFTSPFRKQTSDIPRTKSVKPNDEANPAPTRFLWPYTSRKSGTLADALGNDRLIDLSEGRPRSTSNPVVLTRQKSCNEFSRIDQKENEQHNRKTKENRPMRYFGKLVFPRSSSKLAGNASPSGAAVAPARLSVDKNTLTPMPAAETPAAQRYLKLGPYEQKSGDGLATTDKVANVDTMMRRSNSSNSCRSSPRQWALSPGRPVESPPTSSQGLRRSNSAVRAESPVKNKGVGNFINSLGFDLFKKKSSTMAGGASWPPVTVTSTLPRLTGGVVVGEMGHQFRLQHNRLIQWRYVNARADAVNHIRSIHAENMLLSAWVGISKLQASVVQKQVLLDKEKLGFKVNKIVSSQMEALEEWGSTEKQHFTTLSTTKDCLDTVACKVPLIEGAEANPYQLAVEIEEATDLGMMINSTINEFAPMAQSTVPLLFELAQVVAREKSLLQECFELIRSATALQLQEHSLRCHQIQLNSLEQQELSARNNKLISTQLDMELEYLR